MKHDGAEPSTLIDIHKVTRVIIQTIPHKQQRYDTVGDWYFEQLSDGQLTLRIFTSDLGDWRKSMACAIHETIEALLCYARGIREIDVSNFDVAYEKCRPHNRDALDPRTGLPSTNRFTRKAPCGCEVTDDSEPGEDRHAPYRKEHAFADGVERLVANELGVVWNEYSEVVSNLDYP
jgi:hypothetical protein